MIFNVFKSRWLRKQQEKLRKETRERPPGKRSSMVVLYDVELEKSTLFLEQWSKALGFKKLTVLGFTEDGKAVSTASRVMLNSKTIKWSGGIADPFLEDVLKSNYDLQINFFNPKEDLHNFVALALKATIKVGLPSQEQELYDLAIDVNMEQKDLFITELKKYLNIITK